HRPDRGGDGWPGCHGADPRRGGDGVLRPCGSPWSGGRRGHGRGPRSRPGGGPAGCRAAAGRGGRAPPPFPRPRFPPPPAPLPAPLLPPPPAGAANIYAERIGRGDLAPRHLLDVVYHPWPTALATAAQRAGVIVAGGFPMLLHQAAGQVTLMTGKQAP